MGERVFLGVPHHGDIEAGTMMACFKTGLPGGKWGGAELNLHSSSLLAFCFNTLWCLALNTKAENKFSAFCMLHSDVMPTQDGWLRTLLEERERVGADVLSAVIPIKDERGFSSTAVHDPAQNHMRRLTLTETCSLPTTFSGEDVLPGGFILPNTGCWVCDFTKPWVQEVCFEVRDRIFKVEGEYIPQALSEDWGFGYWCKRKGLKVMATSKIEIFHKGGFDYPNFTPFGTEKTDTGYGFWPGAVDGNF